MNNGILDEKIILMTFTHAHVSLYQLIFPYCHIYASISRLSINNGLSLILCQALIWTSAGLLPIGPLGAIVKENLRYKTFDSRQCIRKYHLRNGGHFVHEEMGGLRGLTNSCSMVNTTTRCQRQVSKSCHLALHANMYVMCLYLSRWYWPRRQLHFANRWMISTDNRHRSTRIGNHERLWAQTQLAVSRIAVRS